MRREFLQALLAFGAVLFACWCSAQPPVETEPVHLEPSEARYRLVDVSVVDGDTIDGDLLLPLDVQLNDERVRFLGVDTWEMRGLQRVRGLAAKEYVEGRLSAGEVWLVLEGDRDSFGRILATVWVWDGEWHDLCADLRGSEHEKGE